MKLALFFVVVLGTAGCARAESQPHVHVARPIVRVMPNGTGALYVDLVNDSETPDRLVRVDSPDVEAAELHTVVHDGDVVAMEPAKDGFAIGPHATTKLEKGGRHVMLFGVKASGAMLPLTLRFAHAGSVVVVATVENAMAAAKPDRRVLRVCADPNNMPFSDDKQEGFENRIAKIVADDLGADLAYTWSPQRRGFVRENLKAGKCDVVMGVPSTLDMVATTRPYYRSGYAFVYAPGAPRVRSLDAPELRHLRVGVPLVGDDGANPPPLLALGTRGITNNLHGYSVYGDYREESPPADAIRALRRGEIDVAVAWGPIAGYYAKTPPALEVSLLSEREAPPGLTFAFAIAAGVRRADKELRAQLDASLTRRKVEIGEVLDAFGVPREEEP